jgi:surface antigen
MRHVLRSVLILFFVALLADHLAAQIVPMLAGTSTSLSTSPNPSTYGATVTLTATVSPSGATGAVTFYDGSNSIGGASLSGGKATFSTSTLAAGTHILTATYNGSQNFNGSTSGQVAQVVNKASATVTLSNLTQTYTGSALTPTATTSPSGLGITWSGAPDTNAGSYSVTATVNDANYQGSASGTFTISKATATVTLSKLTQTYTGSALTPTATTNPSGLAITWSGAPDTNAGKYSVTTTVNNPDYTGSATGTFTIQAASATVTLSNLTQTYTGSALTPTATTSPSGLGITWSGAPDTNAGNYSVTATVNNPNYTGSASGTFTIQPALATVTLSNMSQAYTGSALTPTATTSPSGLGITWAGAPDTNVGSYSVTATVNNPNYTGSASGTFTIADYGSTTSLTSSLNPSNYRRLVTFTAALAVTGSGPAPTGTVTFYNGSTAMGTVTLSSSTASLTPALLPIGSFSITATYNGSSEYAASTSTALTQTVNAPTAGMAPNCPQ